MKILSKTMLEGGTLLSLPSETFEGVAEIGKDRVNVYPVERQEILGFGGAFTESSAIVYAGLSPEKKKQVLSWLFGPDGLRYNFCRICIGSSDFAAGQYDYLAPEDRTLASFSPARDKKYVIPMIHDAMAVCPDNMVFFASPWSPPAFMKDNGKRIGGRLLPEYRDLDAEYFVKFIQAYEQEGIHISAVTPQNEPLAASPWDSCLYDAEEEIALIQSLKKAFDTHGLDTKILCFDQNKGRLFYRAQAVYDKVGDMVAGAAFHWYSGSHFEELSLLRELYPQRLLIHTEFCNGLGRKHFDTYARELMGNLSHGVNAECEWNLMLDPAGGPYHHRAFGCSAPLHTDAAGNILRRSSYYETFLFSHFIRRGARALAVSSYHRDIRVAAFRNPDNRLIVILHNDTDGETAVNLTVFDQLCQTSLPPRSLVTYEIEE